MNTKTKIVVIGGSGLIGSKVVASLRDQGHEVVAASPSTGVNALTGEGLAGALAGADIVVDVANSPSFEDGPVMDFFRISGENLMAAEKAAGVKHHLALSVVGTDRLQASGYFRAKLVQENLIRENGIPFTIIRATQFFEFVGAITQGTFQGEISRTSSAMMQPISSRDVADAVAAAALSTPVNDMVDLAGPERIRLNELIRLHLAASGDAREIVTDESAGYFGIPVDDASLVPEADHLSGTARYQDWLAESRG